MDLNDSYCVYLACITCVSACQLFLYVGTMIFDCGHGERMRRSDFEENSVAVINRRNPKEFVIIFRGLTAIGALETTSHSKSSGRFSLNVQPFQ
jgi:hypothetical protein